MRRVLRCAGLLSGYHVGGALQPVLWYPDGGYAVFPHRLAGGDNLPAAYQRLTARRAAMRHTPPPGFADTRELAWVPLVEIIEGRCACTACQGVIFLAISRPPARWPVCKSSLSGLC